MEELANWDLFLRTAVGSALVVLSAIIYFANRVRARREGRFLEMELVQKFYGALMTMGRELVGSSQQHRACGLGIAILAAALLAIFGHAVLRLFLLHAGEPIVLRSYGYVVAVGVLSVVALPGARRLNATITGS